MCLHLNNNINHRSSQCRCNINNRNYCNNKNRSDNKNTNNKKNNSNKTTTKASMFGLRYGGEGNASSSVILFEEGVGRAGETNQGGEADWSK